jgi:hypothetical protein
MQCDYCSLCVSSCWSATGTFARTLQRTTVYIENQAPKGARFSQRIILLAISARKKRSIFGKTGHQLSIVRTFNGPTLVPGFLMNQLRCENRAPFYHSTDRRRTNSIGTQKTQKKQVVQAAAASFKNKKQQHLGHFLHHCELMCKIYRRVPIWLSDIIITTVFSKWDDRINQ